MERKIIWLIAASTLLMGILLWSKRDAEKPPPRFSPTVDIQAACEVQKRHWCDLVLPDGASQQERYRCTAEYAPRCVGCLVAIEHARKRGELHGVPSSGCRPLEQWKQGHRRRDPPALAPQ